MLSKLLKTKKGLSESPFIFIYRMIFLIVVAFVLVLLVGKFVQTNIDVRETEARLMIERIMYSPNTFNYVEPETGRVYPGIIDLEKFSAAKDQNPPAKDQQTAPSQRLDAAVSYGNYDFILAAKLELKNPDGTKFKDSKDAEIAPVFLNKDNYNNWKPRQATGLLGPGGASGIEVTRAVLVREGSQTKNALLVIEIIYPNQ